MSGTTEEQHQPRQLQRHWDLTGVQPGQEMSLSPSSDVCVSILLYFTRQDARVHFWHQGKSKQIHQKLLLLPHMCEGENKG